MGREYGGRDNGGRDKRERGGKEKEGIRRMVEGGKGGGGVMNRIITGGTVQEGRAPLLCRH